MNRHPSDEELLEYCEAASTPAAEQVRRHLETQCDRCTRRVASMREILASFRVPPLTAAPDSFVRAALAGLAERQRRETGPGVIDAVKEKVRHTLEEIRLGLALDTAVGAAMQGIRGSATSELRQLLFESEQGTLHLQVEAGSGTLSLTGQLVPAGSTEPLGGGVVHVEGAAGLGPVRLSDAGEFSIRGVPAGTVRVRIEWGSLALVTDPIDLQAGLNG